MQGIYLRLYVPELQKHHGLPLYEWLLEQAKKSGVHGGSAFRSIAGFGRHGVMHEEGFFELAGNLPVVVEFLLSEEEMARFMALLKAENLKLFHVVMRADFGVTGEAG